MRLFLDTSVLLAAAASGRGASCFLVTEAVAQGWVLISTDYCAEEVRRNLTKVGASATTRWRKIVEPALEFASVSFTLDRPLVFTKAKDRPVAISALAESCEWLLTLDEADFHARLGRQIYGMRVATPGEFLLAQREQGLL